MNSNLKTTAKAAALCLALGLPTMASALVTNVLANGSFESGLTGWSQGATTTSSPGTVCGYNVAAPAPGTETTTATTGYAATAGANVALGGLTSTDNSTLASECVIYRDVFIPIGATTSTATQSLAFKLNGGKPAGSIGYKIGLYPTTAIPGFLSSSLATYVSVGGVGTASATLATTTSSAVNIAALAGTTVRYAVILTNANTTSIAGSVVIGLDNLSLDVDYTLPNPVPTLDEWAKGIFAALLLASGIFYLKRRRS